MTDVIREPRLAVLIVDLARGFGGAEMRVIDTAGALGKEVICGVAVLEGSPLHRRLDEAGIRVHPLAFRRGDPRLLSALRTLIRAHEYVVVDAHNVQSQFWGHLAARLEGLTGLISTVHSEYRKEHAGLKGRLHELVLRRNRKWGVHFVAVGEVTAKYLRSHIGADSRVSVIRRGFPLPPLPIVNRLSRTDLGWPDTVPVVGVIGRLAPAKGHSILIDALCELFDSGVAMRCLVAGDGPERAALERQVEACGLSGVVHFAGFRDDIGAVMDFIDILCVASLTEGLPTVVLEAASNRVPIVATEVGEIPVLLRSEVDALLVPPNDPGAMSSALRQAIESREKRERLAESAHGELTRHLGHDWVAQTLRAYRTGAAPGSSDHLAPS